MMSVLIVIGAITSGLSAAPAAPMTRAQYRVLPGGHQGTLPFNLVTFTYGPRFLDLPGSVAWQIEVFAETEPAGEPLFRLRCMTSRDPLAESDKPLVFQQYQLNIPGAGETLDYRDVHTKQPLLPPWHRFTDYFIPHPAKATARQKGVPNTCAYLGHVLTLRELGTASEWKPWDKTTVLDLDKELWVGTGRAVKDSEGHRLPQQPERQDYKYVPWTKDDYRAMIEAGFNLFSLVPGLESYVRTQPVFYLAGAEGLQYPADLYRSNYVGPSMFMDEPTCIMTSDKTVTTTLKFFTDACALITNRVHSEYNHAIYALERQLEQRQIRLGDMRIAHYDIPTWETRYETAWYQLAGGGAGFVHEGRYQLGEFNEFAKASTGLERVHTPEEMFRYYYAFMRGAARHFDKDWGTAIYGQADPKGSPTAIKLAYDMGARYVWYWTSDHDHHLPWNEQIELTRILSQHAREHPRPSIRAQKPTLDKVIAIPYGYFLVLESPTTRKNCWDLWWVREMDAEGKNEASQRYRRLMRRAMSEVHIALDAGEDFDFTVDDGREITGYRKIVRINAD